MSLKGTILFIAAGMAASIPDAFLEKAIEQNQSFAGFATAIIEEDQPRLVTILHEGSLELKDVKDILEDYKDTACYMHFGNISGAFSGDDFQPFTLIGDDEDNPQVVGFLEGMFEDKGGEYEVATKKIIPYLKKIWKACDEDVSAFMQELQTDPNVAEIMSLYYQGRGTITILGNNGETISFGTNALRTEYDWGWTSNPCGYKEEAKEEPAPAEQPKARSFGNARRVQAAAPVISAAGKKTEVEVKTTASAIKASVPPVKQKNDPEMWGPPDSCDTKNKIKQWYITNNNGVVPDGYKNRPLVEKSKTVKSFDALKDRPIASVTPIRQPEKTTGTITKKEEVVASKEVSGEVLPVASPKSKEYLKNTFLKRGTVQRTVADGQTIIDPKRMQATEEKFSTYVEMAALRDLQDVYHYTHEDRMDLIKNAPDLAGVLMMNLTYELARRWPQEEAAAAPVTTATEQPQRRFGGSRKVS